MFEDDNRGEPDEALIAEGRQRVRVASPALTDAQFARTGGGGASARAVGSS